MCWQWYWKLKCLYQRIYEVELIVSNVKGNRKEKKLKINKNWDENIFSLCLFSGIKHSRVIRLEQWTISENIGGKISQLKQNFLIINALRKWNQQLREDSCWKHSINYWIIMHFVLLKCECRVEWITFWTLYTLPTWIS